MIFYWFIFKFWETNQLMRTSTQGNFCLKMGYENKNFGSQSLVQRKAPLELSFFICREQPEMSIVFQLELKAL